ncbi:MAG: alpha-galactosidase [Clostridium fessum]
MYLLLRTIQLHRQTPLWTRANTAFFGTFGYELDLAQLGEDELSELKIQTAFMKQHRSLIQYGTFYRLSSPFGKQYHSYGW